MKAQAIWLLVQGPRASWRQKKLGIEVSDKQIDKRIASIKKQFFEGSDAKYRDELKKEGLTDAEARHLIKGLLISEQLATKVTQDVKVTERRCPQVLRRQPRAVPGVARACSTSSSARTRRSSPSRSTPS